MGYHVYDYTLDLLPRILVEGSSVELVNVVPPQITGTRYIGDTLTCSSGIWTPSSGVTFTYQWYRGASPIGGATANTHVIVEADVGEDITCVVEAAIAVDLASAAVSNTAYAPPVNTVAPLVSGSAEKGSTLSCTTGTWTGTATITYAYQWTRTQVPISGATSSTYVSQAADIGYVVDCLVTADNGAPGTVTTASSNGITVTVVAPVNTVAPAVTGDAVEGSTLTCSNGTWTGTATITFTKAWRKNGVANGSTGNTYVTVNGDVGSAIDCLVTADNDASGTVSADSNDITVTAIPPAVTFDSSNNFGGTATFSNGDKTVTCTSENIVLGTVGRNDVKRFFQLSCANNYANGSVGLRLSGAPLNLASGLPGDTARRGCFADGTRVGILFNPATGERTIYNGVTLWDGPSIMSTWVNSSSIFFPAYETIDHFTTAPVATAYFKDADIDANGHTIMTATSAIPWE